MARPRTDIGTYGAIKARQLPSGMWEAKARIRQRNGVLKPVKRRGRTDKEAIRRLKKAMATIGDEVTGKVINPDSRMGHVMDLWLAEFKEKVELGKRAPKSLDDYRDTIDNHLRPRMGELSCREAENAGLVNEVLKDIRRASAAAVGTKGKKRGTTGTAGMKRARTVLSQVCGFALRWQAMKTNPVKSVEQIEQDDREILVLEPEQRRDFLDKFTAHCHAKVKDNVQLGWRARAWTDLPDIVMAELSTGCRPSEVLALLPESVDLTAGKVVAGHHVTRVKGQGLQRVLKRKGGGGVVEPAITSWALSMWRRRVLAAAPSEPLFPTNTGRWEDPSNVSKRIKEVCEAIGYSWVSSRILRHTTGTHIVDSGLTSADAADALGNTVDVVEKHYRRKQGTNPRVAAAMERMLDEPAL